MNYSIEGGAAVSTVVSQLPGNAIYTVKFEGVESKDIESKTTGDKFKILSIKFKNSDGVFEDSIFELKDGDDQRKKNQFGYESPSALEELGFKIKHLFAAINPKVAEKLEKSGLPGTSWDSLREFVVKHTKEFVGTETQIKLLSRTDAKGVTRAQFPSFVLGINKEGKSYPRTNFIGSNLAFTAKEQEKITAASTAKPSNVDMLAAPVSSLKASDLDDLNFDLV